MMELEQLQPNTAQRKNERLISTFRIRFRLLQIGVYVLFVVVILRLVQVQVIDSMKYRDLAQKQYQANIPLPATRGIIYDRNGNVLASNTMFVSFAADPQLASDDAQAIAGKFSQLFNKPKKFYLDKLQSDSRFVWLERQVSADYLKRIDLKQYDGLVIRYEPKRLYHNDNVAGQLIGFTDVDNRGLAGIEMEFNDELQGTDGYVVFQRDGLGRARPSVDYPRVEPENGHSIVLSIDIDLQAIAEKELKKGVEQNKADRGIVIMMKPRTGEVLAIGQYPPVDPNFFGKYPLEDQRLRAVTDVFEPGSVFKIVTASAALEYHLIRPDQTFFAEHGKYYVALAGVKQREITDTHPYGNITFQEAMAYSSNIVMAKASDMIGSEHLYKTARDYGFGIPTSIEFPGEIGGTLKKPNEWSGTTLNTMAYGYEVGVTPLQIVTAYSAVANNGILMKPMLVEREIDAIGTCVKEYHPQQIRRVIMDTTAAMLRKFFEGVVDFGTGKSAKINGITIAGKTGTSRKYLDGHYESDKYTASFVGFFPADDPQFVCLVMMDNPSGGSYYGGTTSAPVFRSIASDILTTSPVFALEHHSDERLPANNNQKQKNNAVDVVSKEKNTTTTATVDIVPDVRGLSVRKAVGILRMRKLSPVVNGSGTVVSQSPTAGQPAKTGMRITIVCQQKSVAELSR